jgi:hypothetical protein
MMNEFLQNESTNSLDSHFEEILPLFEGAPVTVKYAPGQGRYPKLKSLHYTTLLTFFKYMVASRHISSGEIILENEVPYLLG